jgi:hypothetical protein
VALRNKVIHRVHVLKDLTVLKLVQMGNLPPLTEITKAAIKNIRESLGPKGPTVLKEHLHHKVHVLKDLTVLKVAQIDNLPPLTEVVKAVLKGIKQGQARTMEHKHITRKLVTDKKGRQAFRAGRSYP